MKRIILFLALVLSTGFSLQAQTKKEKQIAAKVNELNQAIISTDSGLLSALVTDDLSYGHSSGAIQDKAEFIKKVIEGPNFFKSFELKDQKVEVSGKNAIVRHIVVAQVVNNNVPGELRFGNIQIWKKVDGKWKLFARQGYKI